MKTKALTSLTLLGALTAGACTNAGEAPFATSAQALSSEDALEPKKNDSGRAQTATATDSIDTDGDFFRSLGTNGRTCNTCHVTEDGWSITPAGLRARFDKTGGTDSIFLRLDGADSPTAPTATVAERRLASRNLLSRGTLRIGLPKTRPTPTWDLDIEIVEDPRNSNALGATNGQISFFRRPLPTTNLRFVAAVNWDGRNTPDLTTMRPGLLNQSNGATTGHAQGAVIDDATRTGIVDFELGLYTAQVKHDRGGRLDAAGASGGPLYLVDQAFSIGLNTGASFDRKVFDLYDAWNDVGCHGRNEGRAAIARGQKIFNEKTFGPNDDRTCSGCHNAPNVGSSTRFAFFDVGISARSRWNGAVPLYRVRQKSNPANVVETTDPGRAMITGLFADVNKFKVPGLRGLAARAPYFHDGSASTVAAVVDHYEKELHIGFDRREKEDLVAFLESL